jgi:hypothetical protein
MLRIFVFEEPFSVKLRLEGALTSQTVPLLTQRWADVKRSLKGRKAILDLGDLVDFDDAGRSTLRWLGESGARFGYAPPSLRSLIEELRDSSPGLLALAHRVTRRLRGAVHTRLLRWQESSVSRWICSMLPSSFRPCGCGSLT